MSSDNSGLFDINISPSERTDNLDYGNSVEGDNTLDLNDGKMDGSDNMMYGNNAMDGNNDTSDLKSSEISNNPTGGYTNSVDEYSSPSRYNNSIEGYNTSGTSMFEDILNSDNTTSDINDLSGPANMNNLSNIDDIYNSVPGSFSTYSNRKKSRSLFKTPEEALAEANYLQKYIYNNSNPNPIFVGIMILITFLIVYVLYYIFIRESVSGYWYSSNGIELKFKQNMITNNLTITNKTRKNVIHGKVKNNLIEFEGKHGLWDGNNKIVLLDGTTLTRISN